jgi:hypothetical protein
MQQFLDTLQYKPVRLVYEKWLNEDGTQALDLGMPS